MTKKGPTFKEFYGQSFMEAVEKMEPKEIVKRPEVRALWDKGLLWSLSNRRGYRLTRGYDFPEDDFFHYKATKEVVPLDEVETAILCWFGIGSTGLISMDEPSTLCGGAKQFERRTVSSGGSGMYGYLLFVNDDGIFHYRPHVPTKMVEIEKREDMEIIFRAFKEGITRLGDPIRGGPGAPFSQAHHVAQMSFLPGQTQFIPCCDTTMSLLHFLVRLFNDENPKKRAQPIDELTGKLMCAQHWIDNGYLAPGLRFPWGMLENRCQSNGGMFCGMMIQNVDLAAAAMGLGTYKFSAVNMVMLLGGSPAMKGFGFRFASDKKGYMYPVGRDGLFQAHAPPYFSVDDVADGYYEACWGPKGRCSSRVKDGDEVVYTGFDPRARAVHRPFKDNEGWLQVVSQNPEEPGKGPGSPEARQIMKEVFHYLWDKYGRIPRSIDPIWVPFVIQAQHIPVDFYDKYYKEGIVSPEQREHLKFWHRLDEE